ncbi:MAG: hypothetical protein GY788_22040 [bacterium]|nr:hypothetical protein [bacterium]
MSPRPETGPQYRFHHFLGSIAWLGLSEGAPSGLDAVDRSSDDSTGRPTSVASSTTLSLPGFRI